MVASKQTALVGADFNTWLNNLAGRWSAEQLATVQRAYVCSEPSQLLIADLLTDLGMDHETVAAALLYPLLAAEERTLLQVREDFGAPIARLVDGLLKLDALGELHHSSRHFGNQLESLRKMLLAMAQDLRVVLIRLAMQLHTLRHLKDYRAEEQQRIAQQTLDIFSPLANRLGIGRMKWEMEDLALRYLQPAVYRQIASALEQRRLDREHYIAQAAEDLRQHLAAVQVRAEVSGRVKHIYSIWRKMQRKNLPFEQVFDVRAVRVMVGTVSDCYAALGVVHSLWEHIHHEFDDYIANPKPNGYQSLHTAVLGPEGRTLEVQIRTADMHSYAELGVAAHWRYKEGGQSGGAAQQITWLRQILAAHHQADGEGDALERFKAEAFQARVYAITPKGTIIELPARATPLDFAYHIHTEVGHRCRGAKVNGRIVPLTYALQTGEQVEVLTAKIGAPSRDWLSPHLGYVKSNRARAKIRQWFTQQDQEKSIAAGRSALERELQRLGARNLKLDKVAERLGFIRPEELFATIGHGALTTNQVIARIQDWLPPPLVAEPVEHVAVVQKPKNTELGKSNVHIRGVGSLLTQMAQCCQPAPYEPIAGYITKGRGVTIHRQDCVNMLALTNKHGERVIEVSWGETPATYPVDILVLAHDRAGLLRDIAAVVANEQVNILGVNTLTDTKTSMARMGMTLEITDVVQLSRVLDKITQLRNVMEAVRKT